VTTSPDQGARSALARLGPCAGGALAAWAGTTVLGWAIVRLVDPNPLRVQGVGVPLVPGVLGALVLVGACWWRYSERLVGIAAGAYAGWASMTVLAGLNGTPFGSGGLAGDAGRLATTATHYTGTWLPSDASDPDKPPEYPPLYPMIVGRVAALLDRPAWSLLGEVEALTIGLTVMSAFLLWARLVHPATALAIAVAFVVARAEPSKAFEAVALVVLVPLVLHAFDPPPGRRPLHPVLAGVLFGLCVPLFPSPLTVAILGIAAVLVRGWLRAAERPAYLRHVLVTVGTAVVVSSWYTMPLVVTYVTGTTEVVSDQYRAAETLATDPLQLATAGGDMLSVLRVVGILGTVLLIRRAWWAPTLLLLVLGTQLMRILMLTRFIGNGHSFQMYYGGWVVTYLTVLAGILVTARAVARLGRWAAEVPGPALEVRAALVVTVGLFVSLIGYHSWAVWMPAPYGVLDREGAPVVFGPGTQPVPAYVEEPPASYYSYAAAAHAERLPNGNGPRFAMRQLASPLNADAVRAAVVKDLGSSRTPLVLSFDQRLFAFHDWDSWLPPDRPPTSSILLWDTHHAELQRLARVTDPARFAEATGRTSRGSIDVFYLQAAGTTWQMRDVAFSPAQFAAPQFVVTPLPDGLVVVVRRPAGPAPSATR
jgi:hypothetical protein